MIAGLAVGLGLGAGLLLAAAFFLVRSRKRNQIGAGHSDDNLVQHSSAAWVGKDVNELPTPPIEDASPPVMRMRSELPDQPEPILQQPPTYQTTYHEMSTDNLGAHKDPPR